MEGYVNYFENTYDDVTEKKLPSLKFYVFSLSVFLIVGNLLSLIGLEPIGSSYSVTFTLAFITWMGIFVIGLWFQKFHYLKKFLLPTDLIGQFSPLISLSVRMFGNIIAGSIIVFLLYFVMGQLWTVMFKTSETFFFKFFLAPIFAPFFHLYFDTFGAFMQAMVFTILTGIYWSTEAVKIEKKVKNKKSKTLSEIEISNEINVLETDLTIY